jgi:putative Holliday junction resolvase
MRYLAIDYGTRHTGLAICDSSETIVSPLTVIEGKKELPKKIADIVQRENVGAVVLGLPLNMDNSEGAQARLVRKFAEHLKKYLKLPIHYADERLSSFGAEEKMASVEQVRGKKITKRIDAIAAAEILLTFLENKNS